MEPFNKENWNAGGLRPLKKQLPKLNLAYVL
jgi:hypothetical protein